MAAVSIGAAIIRVLIVPRVVRFDDCVTREMSTATASISAVAVCGEALIERCVHIAVGNFQRAAVGMPCAVTRSTWSMKGEMWSVHGELSSVRVEESSVPS